MFKPFPHDPWGSCSCPRGRLPGATDPRLVPFVESRLTDYGGVVMLSAALWDGDWRRYVPLSRLQAHGLADELLGHVSRLTVLGAA